MIQEAFNGKIDENLVDEIWPEYKVQKDVLKKYTGTNIERANDILESILLPEEKILLERVLFGADGWYKRINGEGMIKIKLASMSLGLTNDIFTFKPEEERRILSVIDKYSEEEQLKMISCYIKQKLVTYLTLKNYLKNMGVDNNYRITLYRGINTEYNDSNKYLFSGMEAWTSNIDIAYRFARDGGYVIEKEYDISQIFAGRRSTFKNGVHNIYKNNGFFVRREHEMIVENIDYEYDCSKGNNVKLVIDKDIV